MKKYFLYSVVVFFAMSFGLPFKKADEVLVFTKTKGFRHNSIPAGRDALSKLGEQKKFFVSFTEDSEKFNIDNLKRYKAVVFLNTTGDVLNEEQQAAFEKYIQSGGGYMGIHAASDCEYKWPWYGKLVGAYFKDHPGPDNVQNGKFFLATHNRLTKNLPDTFSRRDEFYSFKDINPDIKVLIKIDERSYRGGKNGADHPMSWYHNYDGGRAFYTNMGHTPETFSEPLFLDHMWNGLQYVMGKIKVK